MPFLVDSVMAELTERGLGIAPGRASDPGGRRATRPASCTAPPAEARQGQGRGARKLHPHPRRARRRRRPPRRDRAGAGAGAGRGPALRAGLAADDPARQRGDRRSSRPIRRRCRWTTSPRRSSSSNGWRPTISPCSACATTRSTASDRDLKPVLESGLGVLRGGDVPVLHARRPGWSSITPQLRAFFDEPKTLIVTKANAKSRVHRRVYLDYIGVKRFDADGNPSGEFRIVGLFTSTVYIRSIRSIPYPAPQGRRRADAAPASIRRRIPARRWSTCWRPIRATSCSRSTRTRSIISR